MWNYWTIYLDKRRQVKVEELESGLPIFYWELSICKKPDEGVVWSQKATVSNALFGYTTRIMTEKV